MFTLYSLMAKLNLRNQTTNIQEQREKQKADSGATSSSVIGGKCAESNESSALESISDSEGSNGPAKNSTNQSD